MSGWSSSALRSADCSALRNMLVWLAKRVVWGEASDFVATFSCWQVFHAQVFACKTVGYYTVMGSGSAVGARTPPQRGASVRHALAAARLTVGDVSYWCLHVSKRMPFTWLLRMTPCLSMSTASTQAAEPGAQAACMQRSVLAQACPACVRVRRGACVHATGVCVDFLPGLGVRGWLTIVGVLVVHAASLLCLVCIGYVSSSSGMAERRSARAHPRFAPMPWRERRGGAQVCTSRGRNQGGAIIMTITPFATLRARMV